MAVDLTKLSDKNCANYFIEKIFACTISTGARGYDFKF